MTWTNGTKIGNISSNNDKLVTDYMEREGQNGGHDVIKETIGIEKDECKEVQNDGTSVKGLQNIERKHGGAEVFLLIS